jgi:NAD(P)-dependent dehydrogenase (short-subunit alcohol dehydrogenase family)
VKGKKQILITGGSGGIGSAICNKLIEQDYTIFNLDKLSPKDSFNQKFIEIDLLDLSYLKTIMQEISRENNLVAFIHCAGYGGPYHLITEVSEQEWDSIFTINVKSAYIILTYLLEKWKSKNFGRFIAIASSLSVVGSKNSVAYSASKHALVGFVKSIADEWGAFGITSNAISPGYVKTAMGVQEDQVQGHLEQILQKTPSKKIATPKEIARVVCFLLDEESTYINGANWMVDGGITAI